MSTPSASELQAVAGSLHESGDAEPTAQGVLPLVAQGELPLAIPGETTGAAGAGAITIRLDPDAAPFRGAPQLSDLGKRIEFLRVSRGISKQALARSSGTSRQQLWRVMTGKSELTGVLCQRLASVLDVDSRTLSSAALVQPTVPGATSGDDPWTRPLSVAPASLSAYLEQPHPLRATLRTLPSGEEGVPLKRALLDSIEDQLRRSRRRVPDWLLALRGEVLNSDL
jgi:transcriptional regulator with XRE-family HTH domain